MRFASGQNHVRVSLARDDSALRVFNAILLVRAVPHSPAWRSGPMTLLVVRATPLGDGRREVALHGTVVEEIAFSMTPRARGRGRAVRAEC
jgi:hypothetical protein